MNEMQQSIKIADRLRQIVKGVDEKERKQIYRKAAKPLIKQAKSNVPVKTGALKRSIKELPIAKMQDAIYVGPRISRRSKKRQPFYAHFIEYGKKGYEGVRYMSRAYDSTSRIVLTLVERGLIDAYRKTISRVSNR